MKKKEYQVLKLDKDFTREQLETKCLPFVARSFPVVFYADGIYLGDLTALKMAAAQGKL